MDLESIRVALNNGANPNSTDTGQYRTITVLSRAVDLASMVDRPGDANSTYPTEALKAVQLLLKAGAKLQPYDGDILYGPIYWGNLELTKIMIQAGASPQRFSYRTGSNITPMELAETKNWSSIIELLESRGIARLEKLDSLQLQFIDKCSFGKAKDLKALYDQGIDINKPNRQGETALGNVIGFPMYDAESFLKIMFVLDKGADVNQGATTRTGQGQTPLSILIYNSSFLFKSDTRDTVAVEIVFHQLIQRGAAVSSTNSQAMTPLHYAAKYNNLFAANLLIKNGAKVMPKDKLGKTPLDYAEFGPMIQLLKDNGARE
jgi:ankyrin repeat protein